MQPSTIVFITGAFVHHSCWDEWKSWFEKKGFTTIAPPWPHKNAPAETLRNSHPNAEIAGNRLSALIDYYANIVEQLPDDPILIGHSIGGLIVQVLLQRGLGASGVAIHSVPPMGVMTFKRSFLKAGWGPLGFFTSTKKTFLMSFEQWRYAFTNGMDYEAQKAGYYKYAIPESKLPAAITSSSVSRPGKRTPTISITGSSNK